MRDKAIAVLSIIGLLFGSGTLILGETTAYNCPEQPVGQPSNCPPIQSFELNAIVPVVIIVLSIVGLAYSLLPSTNSQRQVLVRTA